MHALFSVYLRFLYGIRHHLLFDIRLQSWLLALLALLATRGWLSGGAAAAGLWAGLALFLLLSQWWAQRHFYVHFMPTSAPPPAAADVQPLWPADKLAAIATGEFSVNQRCARLTHLPAYYRTFETREHAIMARCTPTRFLAAALDARLLSMWYIFITPEALMAVQPGQLYVGWRARPALRLTYGKTDARGRQRRQVCFLAFASAAGQQRVHADLLLDAGGPAQAPWRPDQGS